MMQRDAILIALRENGAMTTDALAADTGMKQNSARAVVAELHKQKPKIIYIKDWERGTNATGRFYPRALYALGNKPDTPSPGPLTHAERSRRCRSRLRNSVSSIFDLAKRVDDLRVGVKRVNQKATS